MGVRRALCAEDNAVNQKVIGHHLRKLGFVVDMAQDGAEAVSMVNSHPGGYYSFVLMDLQMPVMDGFVATRMIRNREGLSILPGVISPSDPDPHPLPIIALTANAMPGVEQRCSDAGMDGYISKPVQAPQLQRLLKELSIL